MKKVIMILIILIIAALMGVWLLGMADRVIKSNQNKTEEESLEEIFSSQSIEVSTNKSEEMEGRDKLTAPLQGAGERVTKKPFGSYITPSNSPISPERFFGYHNAADFEILPGEENKDVPVFSVCNGQIVSKRIANGYGGMLVQSCKIDNQDVTVLYGHLDILSISKKAGDDLFLGEKIGVLGEGYSGETDGERKHLHLGIHKGSQINILGYVQTNSALSEWIDPCLYFCK